MRPRRLLPWLLLMLLIFNALPALAITVPPGPPPDPPKGPTSLETIVMASGGNGSASGEITITNVGENTGAISKIRVTIEVRLGNQWVVAGQTQVFGTYLLETGKTVSIPFSVNYTESPNAKAHRVVSCVTLDNHPRGSHDFISRASF